MATYYNMKISISNIAWDRDLDSQVSSILQKYAISSLDVAPSKYFPDFASADANDIKLVRDWWADRGIDIIGMQSLLYNTKGLNLFGDKTIQDQMLCHLGNVCRIADALNARKIVFGSPKNRDRSGFTAEQAFDISLSFFDRLASIAKNYGVTICLEPNPVCYGSNFMTTSAETAAVVNAVGSSSLKMQFDTGALCINAEDAFSVCADLHHLIGHIHVSEPELVPVGTGSTNHNETAKAIRTFLPESTVTIEMLTDKAQNPLAAIEASIVYVTSYYGTTITDA